MTRLYGARLGEFLNEAFGRLGLTYRGDGDPKVHRGRCQEAVESLAP